MTNLLVLAALLGTQGSRLIRLALEGCCKFILALCGFLGLLDQPGGNIGALPAPRLRADKIAGRKLTETDQFILKISVARM
jgi:hypothetical protein